MVPRLPLNNRTNIFKFQIAQNVLSNFCAYSLGLEIPKARRSDVSFLENRSRDIFVPAVNSCTLPHPYLQPSQSLIPVTETQIPSSAKTPFTIENYMENRLKDRKSVVNLPNSTYVDVMSSALGNKMSYFADCVASDVLEVFQGGALRRQYLLLEFLSLDFACLNLGVVLRILNHLDDMPGGLNSLTIRTLRKLAKMVSEVPVTDSSIRDLLHLLYPVLVKKIKHFPAPIGILAIDYHPPGIIYAAFQVARKLLVLSMHQQGLEIFRSLLYLGQIPSNAIQEVSLGSRNFRTIISTALVRASLHWKWRALSINFMDDILEITPNPDSSILDLNSNVIVANLDGATRNDVRACAKLIYKVHDIAPVSDSIIRQFYDRAAEVLATAEAEKFYEFTRSPSVLFAHKYSPPQGVALSWLALHLIVRSHKMHLARILASEALEFKLPIPAQYRAKFLSLIAAQGYGTLARNLWERFANESNRELILGDSALMIRIISLFHNLSKRAVAKRVSKGPKISADAQARYAAAFEKDLKGFIDRVLTEFKKHHQPLAQAPHQVLTSLARANFILGRFADGLKCFEFLARRKELPDLHDVNVLLSALAQLSPRTANKMTRIMEAKGLQPDSVTFGTILHHAILHRDKSLVESTVKRMQNLGDKFIPLKSMASLIHATLMSSPKETQIERQRKLGAVMHLIKSFPKSDIRSSSQMGKYLVYQSLEAKDAILAYGFWEMFLKDGAEWRDLEQRQLRRHIILLIQRQKNKIERRHLAIILSKLFRP